MQSRFILLPLALVIAACGSETPAPDTTVEAERPAITFTPEKEGDLSESVGKLTSPVRLSYRIVGTPVVGKAVTLDMQLESMAGPAPITIDYRLPDATAVEIPSDQPRTTQVAVGEDGRRAGHQITVIPKREGRMYVNVSASVETPNGTMSTVTAVPIQVGEGGRTLTENGTLTETASGETVRSLPAQ